MKDKPLETPLTTESELVHFIIDRYCQYIDGVVKKYNKKFDALKEKASHPETIKENQEYTKVEWLSLEANSLALDMAWIYELVPYDIGQLFKRRILRSKQYSSQSLPEQAQQHLEMLDELSKEIDRFMEELK